MFDLVTTLIGGILFIITVYWLLHHFTRLNGKAVAMWVAFMIIGIVIPYSIMFWPGADVFAIHLAVYLMTAYILGIIASQTENHADRGWHWGPFTIAGFFLVVVSVDSVFITLATKGVDSGFSESVLPKSEKGGVISSKFPGTVSHDYYQKGEQYNAYREQVEKQQALGWKVSKGWMSKPIINMPAEFKVRILDRDTKPVTDAKVVVQFLRPSDSKKDHILNLSETAPGDYLNQISLPVPGSWDVVIKIQQAEHRYELRASTTVDAE